MSGRKEYGFFVERTVNGCHDCPFFMRSQDGMECGHPYWTLSDDPYGRMIITQGTILSMRPPAKCPLRLANCIQITKYEVPAKTDNNDPSVN